MKIKVWGCRGSLPTPGKNTIRYGGNTTCLEVRLDDGTLIVIDAGSGIKNLGQNLLKEQDLNEIYLLLTHAHWDHLIGFPFFTPAYSSKYKIYVRGGPKAKDSLHQYLTHQMEPPFFPVPFGMLKAQFDFTFGNPLERVIGSARVIPIPLNHPNGGYGFKIIESDKVFVFLPDNELDFVHGENMTKEVYVDYCKDATLLIHDTQYSDKEYETTRGWGHTKLSSIIELGVKAGIQQLGLFHHDPDRTDEQMDGFVTSARAKIAQAKSEVDCFGVKEKMEIVL